MKRTGSVIASAAGGIAILALAAGAAFAQGSNEGKPAAPAPSKAGSLEAGGKPQTMKGAGGSGGAMMKKGGAMKGGAMMKKKKHK